MDPSSAVMCAGGVGGAGAFDVEGSDSSSVPSFSSSLLSGCVISQTQSSMKSLKA